jgi:hypothetical protein
MRAAGVVPSFLPSTPSHPTSLSSVDLTQPPKLTLIDSEDGFNGALGLDLDRECLEVLLGSDEGKGANTTCVAERSSGSNDGSDKSNCSGELGAARCVAMP